MSSGGHVQEGFRTLTSYLYGGPKLLDFVKDVFGAEVKHAPAPEADGKFHSEAKIGDSMLMIGNGYFADPSMAAATWIYVPDVDATYKHALRAGATALREPADQTWG